MQGTDLQELYSVCAAVIRANGANLRANSRTAAKHDDEKPGRLARLLVVSSVMGGSADHILDSLADPAGEVQERVAVVDSASEASTARSHTRFTDRLCIP